MKKITQFVKDEIVLCIAIFLAVFSMFVVTPSKEYATYMNWKVLSLLLCLMVVVEGLKQLGVFSLIAEGLMKKVTSFTQVVIILVLLCFISSMIITNDVALITFVPFAIEVLQIAGKQNKMISVIVLQTIAANLGSMLTPIGNPQNLYLYDAAGFSFIRFLKIMSVPCAVSFVLLFICCILVGSKETMENVLIEDKRKWTFKKGMLTISYILLFCISILVVAGVVPYELALCITVLSVFITDRKTLFRVDYCLLLTFCGFFIFVGNMGNIDSIASLLQQWMHGREFIVAVLSSQIISNVPAALLLSEFTSDFEALLLGVNIGGLGTLIASMASLISYKLFAKAYPKKIGKYMICFTGMNLLYLLILGIAYYLFG